MKRAIVHLAWIGALLWGGAVAAQQGEALTPVDPSVGDVGPLSESLREVERGLRQPTGFSRVYRVPGRADLLMRGSGGLFAVFPQSVYARGRAGTLPLIPPNTVFYIGWPEIAEPAGPMVRPASAVRPEAIATGAPVDTRMNLRVDNRYGGNTPPLPREHPTGFSEVAGTAAGAPRSPEEIMRVQAARSPLRGVPQVSPNGRRASRGDGAAAAVPPRTIVTDSTYRTKRVRALLRSAARAEQLKDS